MLLADRILDKIVEVASSGRSRIAVCDLYGVSCEGWLKVELLRAFTATLLSSDNAEILPEHQNVDLTIRTASEEVLLELKTFPTNYGRPGKPITNFIGSVVSDLKKLSIRRTSSTIGLAVWMAYPVPDPLPATWPNHVAKVEAAAARTRRGVRIPLLSEKQFANLYIMESH